MDFFDKMKKYFLLVAVCMVCLGQLTAQNVAKIGSDEYATLQAAVDAAYNATYATPTNVTIELIADIEAYTVVRQKNGLNLTIDGNNKTYSINGQILIDGMGQLTSETLKITGIAFTGDGTTAGFTSLHFVSMPAPSSLPSPYTASRLSDAHNVTVDNCSFNSTSTETPDNGLVAVYTGSGTQCNNITVQNCTGTNLHSLVQVSGTTGLKVDGCTVTGGESFIGIQGGGGTYIVQNCNFTTTLSSGYGIRSKSSSTAEITLSDNVFSALSANVLQLGKEGGQNSSGSIYVESGEYYGNIVNAQSAAATATFVLSGGTFKQDAAVVQGYCAYGYEAVASDPTDGYCTVRKLEVAQIGTTTYPSLQDAVDSVRANNMTGDVTIILLKNTEEDVYIRQKENLDLTINGNGKTLTGRINVHGNGNSAGTDKLTITNFKFEYNPGLEYTDDTKGFICYWPTSNGHNYAHNVTLSHSTFVGNNPADGMTAFRGPSGSQSYNTTIEYVVASNMHSLAQFQGAPNGLTITNCKAVDNVKNGINVVNGDAGRIITITNDTLSCTGGDYSFRINSLQNAFLSDNLFTSPVVIRGTQSGKVYISSGRYDVIQETSYTAPTRYSITGGTYNHDVTDSCATGYAAFDDHNDAPHTWTVYPMAIVHFDANGAEGTMADTIVKKGEPYVIPECQFTPVSPYNFAGWKDVLGNDYNVGTTITLIQDTTLIAQWSLAKTITYHSNFDTDATLIQTKLDDETVTLYDATAFERVGHNLVGWNTQADGNGTPYELGASYSTNENLILYAVWELKPCPNANTVSDIDGNTYNTVRIGSKYLCWMSSSLKSNRYSNGREIKNVMQYPVNTRATVNGNLYDWYAVVDTQLNDNAAIEAALAANTSIQGVCPTGYHIPTEEEVTDLMSTYDPRQLMSAGWLPDSGTNESGFNMLPSGSYNSELNRYERMYVSAYFWILTPPTYVYHACEFGAACSTMELVPGSLTMGFSVRCIANE